MGAVSGVSLAMLADDESEFLEWLATTGDIWATCEVDESGAVLYEPLPAKEFRRRFAKQIRSHDEIQMYLGHREDVLKPRIHRVTIRSVVPHQHRREIDAQVSLLIHYRHGLVNRQRILQRTSVFYYPAYLKGDAWVQKPAEWVKWARMVVGWLKRRATEKVPAYQCNDSVPATPSVLEAVATGLKVV